MTFELPSLPYSMDALQPYISQRTLEFHYGKHHKNYVSKLNELIRDTPYEKMELDEIIRESAHMSDEDIFNNAAQAWNHDFYWHCFTPKAQHDVKDSSFINLINKNYGSVDNLKIQFTNSAKKLFGSGWTWLVLNSDGSLSIQNMKNADTPLAHDQVPLLTCDVWEHAYYLDYQNERPKYLTNFWEIVDWHFVEDNLNKSSFSKVGTNKNQSTGKELSS
ncbi:MAG: Fe-Mn family superoxide dismutase [Bacteriovorax sp.]|nr:Fe-Mn family superoxide dismutase [Bacteriovorax sp.]